MQPLTPEQKDMATQYLGLAMSFIDKYSPKNFFREDWRFRMISEYLKSIANFREDRINWEKRKSYEDGVKSYICVCLHQSMRGLSADFKKELKQVESVEFSGKVRHKGQWEEITQLPHETPEAQNSETVQEIYRFLNPREKEICNFIQQGLTHAEIARKMGLSRERIRQLFSDIKGRILRNEEIKTGKSKGNCD